MYKKHTTSLNELPLSPLQVTAKGFAPLLQFAYTAKLVLSQENIHEVILCADFLGVHNLEDSCFRFLQAQLQNDSQQTSNGKVEYDDDIMANDAVFSEAKYSDDPGESRQQTNHVASTEPLPADLLQCPKYRKYQYQHNGEDHHGVDDDVDHTSVSPVSSQFPDSRAAPQTLLTPSRIKEEPFVFEEEGDARNGYAELCTEEVLEMELEVEGVPVAAEHSTSRGSPSSCLRSYLQRGGLDLTSVPSTTIQQLLTNRLSLNRYKELVKDRQRDKRESPVNLRTGFADVDPAELTGFGRSVERPASKASISKHEGELDRRSVIFSSAAGERQMSAHSYVDEKFREKVSTLMQVDAHSSGRSCLTAPITASDHSPAPSEPRTQTSSTHSSFSYPEDNGSGSSPSSLPQLDFTLSPHSGSISGLSQCLVGVVERHPHSEEVDFSQGCTKIKSEQGFGASGGNSSDESGSFSEGDSESGISRISGPEVGVTLHSTCYSSTVLR